MRKGAHLLVRLCKRMGVLLAARAGLLLLFAIVLGGVGTMEYTSTPEFCAKCHAMTDEYASWEESKHSPGATCITCHSDPGHFGEEIAHIKGAKYLYYTLFNVKSTEKPVVVNETCQKCHSPDKLPEHVNGAAVSHQTHLTEGATCQSCHAKVVHAEVESRPAFSLANRMKQPMQGEVERLHQVCQTCHDRNQVVLTVSGSTSCSACHADLTLATPENHTSNWIANHGTQVADNQCGQCHLDWEAAPQGPMAQPASFRMNSGSSLCSDCHQTAMPHPEPYLVIHGTEARQLGAELCSTCHSPQTQGNAGAPYAAATFCTECHAREAMPHPDQYLLNHGKLAGASDNPQCQACHSSANPAVPASPHAENNFCTTCHAGLPMPHPPQFLAEHGLQALEAGSVCQSCHSQANQVNPTAAYAAENFCSTCHDQFEHQTGWVASHGVSEDKSCTTCHSEQKGGANSCLDCHPGKPGDATFPWHPEEYGFIWHGAVVAEKGESACLRCHTDVKPTCSDCHWDRR